MKKRVHLFANSVEGLTLYLKSVKARAFYPADKVVLFNYSFQLFSLSDLSNESKYCFMVDFSAILSIYGAIEEEKERGFSRGIQFYFSRWNHGNNPLHEYNEADFKSLEILKPWSAGTMAYYHFKKQGYEVFLHGFTHDWAKKEREEVDKYLTNNLNE